jgi:hypothetical protein
MSLWRNSEGNLAHPNSPDGGGGPGHFKSAGSLAHAQDAHGGTIAHPFSPVGRKLHLGDYSAVEGLLRKAGLLIPIGPVSEAELQAAIRTLQTAVGLPPSGRVDPHDATMRALKAIVEPLKIKHITPVKIDNGGYEIAISPFVPASPYTVRLGISPADADCVDITGCEKKHVLNKERLFKLIAVIKRLKTWGVHTPVKVYLRLGSRTITESPSAQLPCPVLPHNGTLLPLDETNNGPKLKYLGDSEHGPFYGRMLEVFEPGLLLFKYGGVLETNPQMRGFDCITYCGTVCGASTSHMYEASDLAKNLGAQEVEFEIEEHVPTPQTHGHGTAGNAKGAAAQKVEKKKVKLENAKPAVVKKFFETDRPGRYIMWSGGHVVLVQNNTVHEFALSKKGYSATDVKTWLQPYHETHLTVRKL